LAPVSRPTPLAGAPLRPLEYYSRAKSAETDSIKNGGDSGIRTHGALPHGSFQDCFLKPLGHLSSWAPHTPYRMPYYDSRFGSACQEANRKSLPAPLRCNIPLSGPADFRVDSAPGGR